LTASSSQHTLETFRHQVQAARNTQGAVDPVGLDSGASGGSDEAAREEES
jgi:hypothetical protein